MSCGFNARKGNNPFRRSASVRADRFAYSEAKFGEKGIEGAPFVILASVLVLAIVLAASFGLLSKFLASTTEANFREDVLGLWQSMNTLVSAGDRGSFRAAFLTIPNCCMVNVSIDSDKIIGVLGNSSAFSFSVPGDVTKVVTTSANSNGTVSLGPGRYELRVYYGTPENYTNWMIVFG